MDISRVVNDLLDEIKDLIAKEGLRAMKKVLDSEGFSKYEHLRDYEAFAHTTKDGVTFELVVDFESFDDASKDKVESATISAEDEEGEEIKKTFSLEDGKIRKHRVSPVKKNHDKRRDARKRASSAVDSRHTADERRLEHEVYASSPRSMHVNRQGKISIRMKHLDDGKGGLQFSQKKYEGILGEFIDKTIEKVNDAVVEAVERALARVF